MKKLLLVTLLSVGSAHAAELTYHFLSPMFNGIGYSAHVLTIKQLEDQAVLKQETKAEELRAKAEQAAKDTPQARFVANLESRIYSQLAKQLTDSMFGEGATCTTLGVVCGNIPDLGGNSISWRLGDGEDRGMIIIDIVSLANANQTTTMKVPAGTFAF
jgi:hypothetical protein